MERNAQPTHGIRIVCVATCYRRNHLNTIAMIVIAAVGAVIYTKAGIIGSSFGIRMGWVLGSRTCVISKKPVISYFAFGAR